MVWVPRLRAAVVNVACPPLSVPVPSVVPPSLNVTTPVATVGIVAPTFGDTVAVKVTDCPTALGFTEEASVAAEAPLVTVIGSESGALSP